MVVRLPNQNHYVPNVVDMVLSKRKETVSLLGY